MKNVRKVTLYFEESIKKMMIADVEIGCSFQEELIQV